MSFASAMNLLRPTLLFYIALTKHGLRLAVPSNLVTSLEVNKA
jgi:hypothetical protein